MTLAKAFLEETDCNELKEKKKKKGRQLEWAMITSLIEEGRESCSALWWDHPEESKGGFALENGRDFGVIAG